MPPEWRTNANAPWPLLSRLLLLLFPHHWTIVKLLLFAFAAHHFGAFAVKIPYDKLLHFAVGALIAILVVIGTGSVALAGAVVLMAGVGRELHDAYHADTHTADIWDIAAPCAGRLPVVWAVQIIQR